MNRIPESERLTILAHNCPRCQAGHSNTCTCRKNCGSPRCGGAS